MKLQPLGARVLIETQPPVISKTIIQAEDHQRPPSEGIVLAVGPKAYDLSVGDKVFFDFGAIPSWWDGAKQRLIERAEVLAIL